MKAYNIADLERELAAQGWTVSSDAYVSEQAIPGQVNAGGYNVELTAPTGEVFHGSGPTRTDAVRTAAETAGLITTEQPHLQ